MIDDYKDMFKEMHSQIGDGKELPDIAEDYIPRFKQKGICISLPEIIYHFNKYTEKIKE